MIAWQAGPRDEGATECSIEDKVLKIHALLYVFTITPNDVPTVSALEKDPGTSTQWEAFGGFTYLLPHRLWSGDAGHQHR
jgi:hypothetical protein